MQWNRDENFPRAEQDWAAWRPPFGLRIEGKDPVWRATRRWHAFDPLLVSAPGSKHMLPPVCVATFASSVQAGFLKRYRWLILLMASMTLSFAAAGAFDRYFARVSGAFLLLLIFALSQYAYLFRQIARLQAYSRFCAWCYLQPLQPVAAVSALLLCAGMTQMILQRPDGDLVELLTKYGLVFVHTHGQSWRFLTGPFFHAGLGHWLGNLTMLMLGGGIAFALGSRLCIWTVFLIGTIVPGIGLAWLPGWVGGDAYLGVSGGVFAVHGWIFGVSLRNRTMMPPGFGLFFGHFTLATMAVSSLLDPRTSAFSHFFGMLFGFVVGWSNVGFAPQLKGRPSTTSGSSV